MKIKIYYIAICLFLAACGGEAENKTVISMEDFAGETGENTEYESLANNSVDSNSSMPQGVVNQFVHTQLQKFDTTTHAKFHSLDRFTFNQRKKIVFKSKSTVEYGDEAMVTPVANFFYYSFKDTTKTKNAFYNWLDCFSDECEMVKLGEDFKHLKMPPQFSLIYDTMIVVVDYRCEDKNFNWKPFQDSIIAEFGKNYNYRMQISCGGPLKWK